MLLLILQQLKSEPENYGHAHLITKKNGEEENNDAGGLEKLELCWKPLQRLNTIAGLIS